MNFFRTISLLEGISYLLILSVSLGFISRDYVFPLGAGHGALFILYILVSMQVSHKQGWPLLTWLLMLVASVVPFAFIPVEMFLKKKMDEQALPEPS